MIEFSTPPVLVNPADQDVQLSHEQVWQGLVWKAQFPTLFVAPILECAILETFEDGFLREILHRTRPDTPPETIHERVFLEPMDQVSFLRLSGTVPGQILNVIETDGDELTLRFSFTLALAGAAHGGGEEAAYLEEFSAGYIAAVEATLEAVRGFVRTGEDPTRALAEARSPAR